MGLTELLFVECKYLQISSLLTFYYISTSMYLGFHLVRDQFPVVFVNMEASLRHPETSINHFSIFSDHLHIRMLP
jgi:hypothetical protein